MFALGLITCIVLRAFSAEAKVVPNFNECRSFFYKNTEPRGMDPNAKKICQMLDDNDFYATLYSVPHKIPLYSAYTLDPDCSSDNGRTNFWHLEPQIFQPAFQHDSMVRENQNTQQLYKINQAISSDYRETGYDRGHLNPNSFQCDAGRIATFTLTNAAPMDACFNRIHWKSWESKLRSLLTGMLEKDSDSATAYIVTGTVPDPNVWIPHRENSEDTKRVSVPSHIWTAICYKHITCDRESFSFGYMGRNQPEGGISLMSVSDLNHKLSRLYSKLSGILQSIEIFVDDCFGESDKLVEVQSGFEKLMNLQVDQAVQMSSDTQKIYQALNRAVRSDITSMNNNINIGVSEMTVKLAFDSMSTYYNVAEDLKVFSGSACLITNVESRVWTIHHELRKREVSKGSDAVECLLVPEMQKTAADGSLCSSITESDYSCQCNTGGKTKPCCSSPCLYQGKLKGYMCYSGQKLIKCSPRYSLITVNGDNCLDDNPCATYGEDYYWCWTAYNPYILDFEWGYCSPPLRSSKAKNGKYCRSNHACAKYFSKYTWCYTDDEGDNDQCCISDDCHSAVNGQTCRSGHPCGYHGYTYLWCYTDYKDNWDYCCTNCSQ